MLYCQNREVRYTMGTTRSNIRSWHGTIWLHWMNKCGSLKRSKGTAWYLHQNYFGRENGKPSTKFLKTIDTVKHDINFSTAELALVPISKFTAGKYSCSSSQLYLNSLSRHLQTYSCKTVLAFLTYIEKETLFWQRTVHFEH